MQRNLPRSRTDTEERLLFAQGSPLQVALLGRSRSPHFEHGDFIIEVLKLPFFYLESGGFRLRMTDPRYKFTRGCWAHQNSQMMSFLSSDQVQNTLFWDNGTQEADLVFRRCSGILESELRIGKPIKGYLIWATGALIFNPTLKWTTPLNPYSYLWDSGSLFLVNHWEFFWAVLFFALWGPSPFTGHELSPGRMDQVSTYKIIPILLCCLLEIKQRSLSWNLGVHKLFSLCRSFRDIYIQVPSLWDPSTLQLVSCAEVRSLGLYLLLSLISCFGQDR